MHCTTLKLFNVRFNFYYIVYDMTMFTSLMNSYLLPAVVIVTFVN